jgi:hypothetical protein
VPRLCHCPADMFIVALLDGPTIVDVALVDDDEYAELCALANQGAEWLRTEWGTMGTGAMTLTGREFECQGVL